MSQIHDFGNFWYDLGVISGRSGVIFVLLEVESQCVVKCFVKFVNEGAKETKGADGVGGSEEAAGG